MMFKVVLIVLLVAIAVNAGEGMGSGEKKMEGSGEKMGSGSGEKDKGSGDKGSGSGEKGSGSGEKGSGSGEKGSGSGEKGSGSGEGSGSGSAENWPEVTYDPNYEICLDSGPKPCPQVHVPLKWSIFDAQGDWYLMTTDNNNNQAGCIGCNTAQIAYWQALTNNLPQFILNSCCLISCKDPAMMKTGGVKCGDAIGTGFISPAEPSNPEWGIINYSNLGTTYRMNVIGFDSREFLIIYGCVSYKEGGKTKTYNVLRVYTRQVEPSALTLQKINQVLSRYPFTRIENFQRINQGNVDGVKCLYV